MGVGWDRMAEPDAATPSEPRDFALVQAALGLHQRGDFEWAVVALQTASEVALEQHVARMLEWRELGSLGGAIESLGWTYRFDDGRFKKLWAALTGDSAEKLSREESWWSAYAGHIKLRHDVVHGGATATAQEAERSIEGVLGAINYAQNTMIRIGVELGQLREVGTPGRPRQRLPDHDRQDESE